MNKIKEGDIVEAQIEFTTSGNASIKLEGKEFFIHRKKTKNSLHLDTILAELFKGPKGKIEAKVLEVKERFKEDFVGTVHINGENVFVIPDNTKISVDFYIKGESDAKNGQKVLVKMINWEEGKKSPKAKITKILGEIGENNTEMNAIMYEYGLPVEFPQIVLNESELVPEVITEKEIKQRRDMRDVLTFTIDPEDAKDFDDALSIKKIGEGTYQIGVHIADVSHYVKFGTELDKEAYKRATSVYLVDRCVPMLPERLSNGICSLKPNVDRLAFSAVFDLDKDGKVKNTWFGKTVIHSDHRFTYEQAQSIIDGVENGEDMAKVLTEEAGLSNIEKANELGTGVLNLDKLAKKIRKARIRNGSIEMGGIEVRFKLAEDNKKPIGVYFKIQKDANKLIEEFMLLANKAVAKQLAKDQWHNVYRVHDKPNEEKLNALKGICDNFGYDFMLDEDGDVLKKNLNKLLIQIKGTPEENMIETLVTRCMSKAVYTIKNIGHYGLGFTHYSHFTSPIRRYPDLITHRILFDRLTNGKQGNPTKIEEQAKWCSSRELIAAKAQRDSIKYKQAEYLLDKIGRVFDAIVTGVLDRGIYAEIQESKCEGLIRVESLGSGWTVDVDKYLAYDTMGDQIRLGDPIKVVVKSVDLEKKQINFTRF
jgi:ribonuclease R